MDKLLLLSQCASGLGVFFIGVAAIWYVAMQTAREN
jgi:hypothetical protein